MPELKKPSDLVFRMFAISGMMVPPDAKFSKILTAYVYGQCACIAWFLITAFISLAADEINIHQKLECFQYGISTCHIMTKHINIVLQRKRAITFFSSIDDLWSEYAHDCKYKHLFVKAHKSSLKTVKTMVFFYTALVPLNITLWIVKNYVLSPGAKILPMAYWVFFDYRKYFILASFYQCFIIFNVLLSVGMSVSLVRIIAEQASTQMQVLCMMLESRSPEDKDTHTKMYKLHQKIIILVKEVNAFFSGQYCFEMVISSLQIATRGYVAISAQKEERVFIYSSFLIIMLTVIAPYSICYSGNLIMSQSKLIYQAAYQNQWYLEKTSSRKDLLILMTSAAEPLRLHYRHLMTFSMEQFTKLIQATYSYITMIKHFYTHL